MQIALGGCRTRTLLHAPTPLRAQTHAGVSMPPQSDHDQDSLEQASARHPPRQHSHGWQNLHLRPGRFHAHVRMLRRTRKQLMLPSTYARGH
eukprot:6815278-Alexandrium_andersonii.AAC.1